jgi:probable rRNA maturation factor
MSADGSSRAPLRVSVVDGGGRPFPAPSLARWLVAVAPARARGLVTIAIVSDQRMRALNRQFRGVDAPTDVLSFPIEPTGASQHPERPASRSLDTFLGDIVIARGIARRQAHAHGHAERTEWRVLALHGLLHLLGHDHDADAGVMRRLETRLRRRGGLPGGLIDRRART